MQDSTSKSTGVSGWWRALAITLSLVVLIGWATAMSMFEQLKAQIAHMETRLQTIPQTQFVGVLLDRDGQAQMLTTYDPVSQRLQVQRLTEVRENSEQSLHLWALSKDDRPVLLGVLTSRYATTQLEVDARALAHANELAISVEKKDTGPVNGQPRQPLAFKGWWVQKAI